MRFVAGVHDGAFQRGLEAHLLFEEVGALTDLVWHLVGTHTGQFATHLARTNHHLAGDEMRRDLGDQSAEGHLTGEQVVLVTAVTVALAVGVVLVAQHLGAVGQQGAGCLHAGGDDGLGSPVEPHHLERVAALGGGDLGVGMVDVVTSTVGEHGVHQMALDLGGEHVVEAEPAGVASGVFVLIIPPGTQRRTGRVHTAGGTAQIGVDQQ